MEDYWSHGDAEREIKQLHALADAGKAAGVQHAVYSTLDDSRPHIPLGTRMPVLQRRFNVPHYDAKAEACQHFRDIGLPTTFLITSIFYESFVGEGPVAPIAPHRADAAGGAQPRLRLAFPMGGARMPAVAVGDIGKAVVAILRDPRRYIGATIGLAGDALTGEQMARAFERVLGLPCDFESPPIDDFRAAGFPGAEELANQFEFWRIAEARSEAGSCFQALSASVLISHPAAARRNTTWASATWRRRGGWCRTCRASRSGCGATSSASTTSCATSRRRRGRARRAVREQRESWAARTRE